MKQIDLKISSYVKPLYVEECEGKYYLMIDEPHKLDGAEISKELYELIIKELSL